MVRRYTTPFLIAGSRRKIDFTDEEGTLVGLLGGAAIAGRLTAEILQTAYSTRSKFFRRDSHAAGGEQNRRVEQGQ
jgi:hypothetical protein